MEAQVDGGPAKALNPVAAESDAAQPDKERERERERKKEKGEGGEAEELGECPSEECLSGGTQVRMEGEMLVVRTKCKKRTGTRSRGRTGSQGCVAASVSHGGVLKCGQAGEDEGRG
jgi:hypothetical protein